MATLLLDIATFLVAQHMCVADGTDLFRDIIPEKPDSLVSLYEYKSDPPSLFDQAVNRSVQITCRDKNSDVARQKALAIYKCIDSFRDEAGSVYFTPNRFGQVHFRQTPFKMKIDENDRAYYTFNMGITTSIE